MNRGTRPAARSNAEGAEQTNLRTDGSGRTQNGVRSGGVRVDPQIHANHPPLITTYEKRAGSSERRRLCEDRTGWGCAQAVRCRTERAHLRVRQCSHFRCSDSQQRRRTVCRGVYSPVCRRPSSRRDDGANGPQECPREDSNLHGRKGHVTLNHARLPIPPLGHQKVGLTQRP